MDCPRREFRATVCRPKSFWVVVLTLAARQISWLSWQCLALMFRQISWEGVDSGERVAFVRECHRISLAVADDWYVVHSNELKHSDDHSSGRSSVGFARCRAALQMPRRSHNLRLLGVEQHSGIYRIDFQDSAAVDAPWADVDGCSDAHGGRWREI